MHTTWFFFSVFSAVWLTSLLWMLMESRRRKLGFSWQEAHWMGWITLSVFSTAVLYGLGTNGILARRYPKIVTASDVFAAGFLLALPVIAILLAAQLAMALVSRVAPQINIMSVGFSIFMWVGIAAAIALLPFFLPAI